MKYTAEQIKPKRYPYEKPSEDGWYWIFDADDVEWNRWKYSEETEYYWGEFVSWFIAIPGAPDELKPKRHPENKPSEDGDYIVYCEQYRTDDGEISDEYWFDSWWNGVEWWDFGVKYFIPYRLDEPVSNTDELEPLGNSEQLEREDDVVKKIYDTGEVFVELTDETFLEIWIDKGQYYQGNILIDVDEFDMLARHWLDLQGYDVTKRKPEIKACPVCGNKAKLIEDKGYMSGVPVIWWRVICTWCRINSNGHGLKRDAISEWNALPRNDARDKE